MKLVDFVIPETLEAACTALRDLEDNGIASAGCTAFHFYTQDTEKTAVLLSRTGLDNICEQDSMFRIGAMTPLSGLIHYAANGWILDRVARHTASHQIRNISTVGGNIAHVFPWADLPVALLALGGHVCITDGKQERTVDMDEYFSSRPDKQFSPGELLSAVYIPACLAQHGFGYVKQRMKSEAFSLCTAAAGLQIDNGKIHNIRVSLGAAIAFPARLDSLEKALMGSPAEQLSSSVVTEHLSDIRFMKKEGMSPEYISELAASSITDAINEALTEARGGES